jgi:hypothetical protein
MRGSLDMSLQVKEAMHDDDKMMLPDFFVVRIPGFYIKIIPDSQHCTKLHNILSDYVKNEH